MTKYTVMYSCGHEGEVNLKGEVSEHPSTLKWLATRKCIVCLRAIRKELATARATAREAGWPELQGTKKQIKWAEIIRAEMLQKADTDILHSKNSAVYWIENREKSAEQLVKEVDAEAASK